MDIKRVILYGAILVVGFTLYSKWLEDYPPVAPQPVAETNFSQPITNVPQLKSDAIIKSQPEETQATNAEEPGQIITVTTDVIRVKINTLGGKIIETKLLQYPQKITLEKPFAVFGFHLFTFKSPGYSDEPIALLTNDNDKKYIAQSGITSNQGPDNAQYLGLFHADKTDYRLSDTENSLSVSTVWKNEQGLKITKTYIFSRNSYEIIVKHTIDNESPSNYQGRAYALIDRKDVPQPSAGFFGMATYSGAAISTTNNRYMKISYSDIAKTPLSINTQGGWASMIEHYFISAWIPDATQNNHFYSADNKNGVFTIGVMGPEFIVPAGKTHDVQWIFYAGPSAVDHLMSVAPNLSLTVDYGWLWIICEPIFWVLEHLHDLLGNWGWAIVLVTVLIKAIFYPLSAISYRSMAAMRTLQPKIEALKLRYADDKQKLSQATMELYRKEKANPFSGCFPVIIQVPVFIALYYVLMESVELRQAPFIFWIQDLSTRDPFFILPILMGLSMVLQQRLSPAPPDPTQAKIMMVLPIFFTFIFLFFPSGLVLYWLVNNLLSVSQQWYITKTYHKAPTNHKRKK